MEDRAVVAHGVDVVVRVSADGLERIALRQRILPLPGGHRSQVRREDGHEGRIGDRVPFEDDAGDTRGTPGGEAGRRHIQPVHVERPPRAADGDNRGIDFEPIAIERSCAELGRLIDRQRGTGGHELHGRQALAHHERFGVG